MGKLHCYKTYGLSDSTCQKPVGHDGKCGPLRPRSTLNHTPPGDIDFPHPRLAEMYGKPKHTPPEAPAASDLRQLADRWRVSLRNYPGGSTELERCIREIEAALPAHDAIQRRDGWNAGIEAAVSYILQVRDAVKKSAASTALTELARGLKVDLLDAPAQKEGEK